MLSGLNLCFHSQDAVIVTPQSLQGKQIFTVEMHKSELILHSQKIQSRSCQSYGRLWRKIPLPLHNHCYAPGISKWNIISSSSSSSCEVRHCSSWTLKLHIVSLVPDLLARPLRGEVHKPYGAELCPNELRSAAPPPPPHCPPFQMLLLSPVLRMWCHLVRSSEVKTWWPNIISAYVYILIHSSCYVCFLLPSLIISQLYFPNYNIGAIHTPRGYKLTHQTYLRL